MKTGLSIVRLALVLGSGLSGGAATIDENAQETDAPLSFAAQFDWLKYEGVDPVHEQPIDAGAQYRSLVMSGFYPDPTITQVGGDYYLVNSTYTYFPDPPVFTAKTS